MTSLFLLALAVACGKEDPSVRDELEALAEKAAPCTTSADCCAVVDGCSAMVYVVAEEDFSRASELVSELTQPTCRYCVTPQPFTLACVEGACVGVRQREFVEGEVRYGPRCGGMDDIALEADGPEKRILGCAQ